MEFASSILSSILSKIGECLVDSSIHQANYLLRFKNIVEDLKREDENLRSTQHRVQHDVERAKRNTEEIEKDVEKWLMDVQNVLEEIQRLEDDIQVKKTFLCGQCPNWRWRYKLSKRAVKKTSVMLKLQESGKFDRVSHFTNLPGVEAPKDFISFKPTEYAFSRIMEALKNDKINMIGLYGMGGVGKTTLAKVVGKEAKEKKLFDEVVMVTVSQNPDFKNIQGQIAESLDLKLNEEFIERRAQRVCKRLKDEKTILIILDDVWKILNLTTIGIPFGDDHKGCTILLTTRQQQVCSSMGCQSRIQLDILNEEEGLILLRKHAGIYNFNVSPTLDDVVKEVVGECRGLPIAIVTIGSALREKSIDDWKDVSKKLKMSKFTDIEIVDQNVYASLKLSYDFLKAEETKFCFLLCSLFPEDYEIDLEELLRYGLGLDLYGDANTIEEARRQLRVTINNLKSSCLLLDAKEGFVKMHDLVRDVALWITSKGENDFMFKAVMRLTEWPRHQGLEQCTAISLMGNRIKVLPDGLVCPKLKILLLDGYYDVKVSNGFFEEMKTLKVASLRRVDLSVKSLQFLTNLVTLELIRCTVSDISSIKKLAQVEILSLKGSEIVELPEELGELSKLRMLDITNCGKLKRIHVNVIPRLSRLEELYSGSYDCFKAWEVEGTSVEQSNASLSELSKLYCLTILSLCINVQPLRPKDFVLPTKLLRYCVTVNYELGAVSYPKSRILKIRGIEATSLVAFKALREKSGVEYLELREIKGCCQNMVPSIDETGLNELKRLDLSYFDELECIIDTTQQQDVAFSNLVDLSLWYCDGLREICSGGRHPRGFLENLETLDIRYCNNMSSLFPSWVLIQRLRKLKKVTVEECDEIEDVFQLEGLCYAKENPFLLSSLESLNLVCLENLRYIWKGPTQQVSLQSLTVVTVFGCHKLRYLFTLSLARSLLQLEELIVRGCGSLAHIVEIKEADENVDGGGGNDVMFPKLRKLQLDWLENFINFYSENSSVNMQTAKEQLRDGHLLRHGLQNLEVLKIDWCKVQVLFQLEGVEQELSFPSLKVLKLKYLVELECLYKGPTHLLSMPNLKKLEVWRCNRLRHMFSPSLARNLLQLEELIIEDCGELEYIVSIKAEENVGGGGGNDVMLPKLRILKLDGVENFINLFTEKFSLGVQTTKRQLRGLRHGLQNLEKLYIKRCRVQVLFHLEGLEQELTFPSLKVLDLGRLEELEYLYKGPTHLLNLSNLKKISVWSCYRLRHMFSPNLARNFMQLEELIISWCDELEQIFIEDDAEYNQTLLKDYLHWPLLFPSLSCVVIRRCNKIKSMFPVSIAHLLSLQNLTTLQLDHCHGLMHLFSSTTLVRNLLQLKTIDIEDCWELEQIIVEEHIEDDHVQLGLFPNLFSITVTRCGKLKSLFPVSMAHLLSLQNLTTLKLDDCHGLTHLFLSTLARNLLQLESIHIWSCGELEQIIVEDHTEDDHVQLRLFPNLSSISVRWCDKLKTLFPAVTIAGSGLQKLNILEVGYCKELEQIIVEDHTEDDHVQLGLFSNLSSIFVNECGKLKTLFSAVTIARSGLQKLNILEVWNCKELEQIIVEDHTEDDHVQLGLFPNLSSISIDGCDKLKTLFPIVTIKTLQKLKTIYIGRSFQLEELFGHKDEPDMTSHREMVLPQLQKLTLIELASLLNFCPVGYHFIFPSLSELFVTRCPKLTTRFSVDQNRSVHAEAEAPQTGREDVDTEQSPPETTRETISWGPPYIGK